MPDVIDLKGAADLPAEIVGGKANTLGRLARAGFPVPAGFCVTVEAFREVGAHGCPALFGSAVVSVRECWKSLDAPYGVAVRSSATTEDGREHSAAGQYGTELWVGTFEDMLRAIERCQASLWAESAISYRLKTGTDRRPTRMAVIVQAMVRPSWAGVGFSRVDTTDLQDALLIEAVEGPGDRLVEGLSDPDRILLSRSVPNQVLAYRTDHQKRIGTADLHGLAGLVLRAETVLGGPQDVEWALDEDSALHVLQSRPITASLPATDLAVEWHSPVPGAAWARMSICDSWLAEPLSPLFATTLFPRLVDRWAENWGGPQSRRLRDPVLPHPMHGTINGYAYLRFDFPLTRHPLRTMALIARWLRFHCSAVEQEWRTMALPQLECATERAAQIDLTTLTSEALLDLVQDLEDESARYWAIVGGLAWHWNASEWLLTQMLPRSKSGREHTASELLRSNDRHSRRMEAALNGIITADRADQERLLRTYLADYGHLVYNLDFAEATPGEDAAPIRAMLDSRRAHRASSLEPSSNLRRAVRLGGALSLVHRWAQRWAAIRDAALHSFTLAWPTMRATYLELGTRIVREGLFEYPADVFFLHYDELSDWVRQRDRERDQWRTQVTRRRERRERQRLLRPPDVVPDSAKVSLFGADITSLALFGVSGTDETSGGWRGSAVSGGSYTGPARVISQVGTADTLEPGEVLVVRQVTPAWAPFLARAGAVVADVGGALSHGSVVAREYGVPAVMGVRLATTEIATGDTVLVDGDAGIVRVLQV